MTRAKEILLVTGLSGAGKSTVLKTLEDLGWETVDNLPLRLLDRLLSTPLSESTESDSPLAVGIGARTRDFDPESIVKRIKTLRAEHGYDIGTLFLDCSGAELERRYAETRRRHPLALDRPASDGIARERELLAPLRRWANRLIDTTDLSSNELAQQVRATFGGDGLGEPTLSVMSFGYARGVPRNADLVFDMRFLRNPHYVESLRPLTGRDKGVARYVKADKDFKGFFRGITSLLEPLLPRFDSEGKSYLTVAVGCTGGRHRSVLVAEELAAWLRRRGRIVTLTHRDLEAGAARAVAGIGRSG